MTPANAEELGAWATATKAAVQTGEFDLRELGRAMTGKWDQDFPAAALDLIEALAAEVVRLRGVMANSRSIQAARQALASQAITERQSHE